MKKGISIICDVVPDSDWSLVSALPLAFALSRFGFLLAFPPFPLLLLLLLMLCLLLLLPPLALAL
jgi:hypothetical protein